MVKHKNNMKEIDEVIPSDLFEVAITLREFLKKNPQHEKELSFIVEISMDAATELAMLALEMKSESQTWDYCSDLLNEWAGNRVNHDMN